MQREQVRDGAEAGVVSEPLVGFRRYIFDTAEHPRRPYGCVEAVEAIAGRLGRTVAPRRSEGEIMEFLIKRTDDDWFDLPRALYHATLRPNSWPSRAVAGWGNHRIEVLGQEVAFSGEFAGILVIFEGGDIPEARAQQIVEESLHNISQATAQSGTVVRIG